MRVLAVLLALAVLPLVPPVAAADEIVTIQWAYTVSVPDPASGKIRVHVALDGMGDAVPKFTFLTKTHRVPVTDVVGGPRTTLQETAQGFSFDVDGPESFTFDVAVNRAAFKEGERLSHVGADFALFKAESFALAYTFSFYEGHDIRHSATVRLEAPSSWKAAGPWNATAPDNYRLPAGHALPRGYVAMGQFLHDETREIAGKSVRYVRLGAPGAYEADLFRYIEKATPYYASVYGPGVERDVLIVNAPDPMFKGGLGGSNSFFVHESVDIRTVAHEYAHVFQLFGTNEEPGASAIWLNEGDADYHSALSMVAADLWGPSDVQKFLDDAAKDATDPALRDARLPDAAYGGHLERFAYHKGTHVVRALDDVFRRASGGTLGVSDLLRRLNDAHSDPTKESAAQHVTNEEIQDEAERALGADMSDFFSRFVRGTEWPAVSEFVPEGQLLVQSLRLDPARAVEGEPVAVRATLVNRGTSTLSRDVELLVDGQVASRKRIDAAVGQSLDVEFTIAAGAPGDHEVRLLYERATLRSLTPPDVVVQRTSLVPTTVRAQTATSLLVFLENQGEQPGTARVVATVDGAPLASTTETVVDGGDTATLTLPFQIDEAGPATIAITVHTPQGDTTRTIDVVVQEPDADGDGIPDSLDAYPANAALWEKSLANDARQVSGFALVALVGAALVAAGLRRR